MSKIYAKLKGLQEKRTNLKIPPVKQTSIVQEIPVIQEIAEPKEFPEGIKEVPYVPKSSKPREQLPVSLIISILILSVLCFYLGVLSSKIVTNKNETFYKVTSDIEQEQKQISLLNKEILKLQSSNKHLKDALQNNFDSLNQNIQVNHDQSSNDLNRIEAILQGNIVRLNDKINKLQESMPSSNKNN